MQDAVIVTHVEFCAIQVLLSCLMGTKAVKTDGITDAK